MFCKLTTPKGRFFFFNYVARIILHFQFALASVVDKEEMDFITGLPSPKSNYVWIGGKRTCHECSTWEWIEGRVIEYFSWRKGEPNNVDDNNIRKEDCIEFRINLPEANGKWNDENCGDKLEFVCKSV